MHDLFYSNDALNVRGSFFGVDAVIYVEGDDDVLFWQEVFSRVADDSFEIESVGGAVYLDEYIQRISDGQVNAIAARDADFLSFLNGFSSNPKVVYTYGYSIENSLYFSNSLMYLTRLWCKSPRISRDECDSWLYDLADKISPLVHFDVANAISGKGVAALSDNCGRYMEKASSMMVCPVLVSAAVNNIKSQFSEDDIENAIVKVGLDRGVVINCLRGHFLASAVHRFITRRAKDFGKKVSLSTESLYAAAIAIFSTSLDGDHPHRDHYINSASLAWESINS